MARHFEELRSKIDVERRRRSEARARETLADILLGDLRRLTGMTQMELADFMGITQPTLSKLESQQDMQISTLNRIVTALGGELEIIAKMPTGNVSLRQFLKSDEPSRLAGQ